MESTEHRKTLEQIRMLHSFDIPTLARRAGVGPSIVYHALLRKPIHRVHAEQILEALSHDTHQQLSLDQVDIITWDDYQFLWIIRASPAEPHHTPEPEQAHLLDEYCFVYARDKRHAARLAKHWLDQRSHLAQHFFTPCPEGFTIGDITVPGHLTAS
ncbi:hypothetical protein KDH_66310 [Dictyobacter sp. S3.2.2.5]|uniref:Uncharacterized protein n=1 Tax=Dictyobacter halimunensis TaxID=3026934 RepID=A0ABQ6G136_9CHLR|nr:hypothetical protein KDH_66310 [Dictyobacter sp. S3.2.2.5]